MNNLPAHMVKLLLYVIRGVLIVISDHHHRNKQTSSDLLIQSRRNENRS